MTKRQTARTRTARASRPGRPKAGRGIVAGLALIVLAGILLWGLLAADSLAGQLAQWPRQLLDWAAYLVPPTVAVAGTLQVARTLGRPLPLPWRRIGGLALLLGLALAIQAQAHVLWQSLPRPGPGGLLGYWVSRGLTQLLGRAGALVVLALLALPAIQQVSGVSASRLMRLLVQGGQTLARGWSLMMGRTSRLPARPATSPDPAISPAALSRPRRRASAAPRAQASPVQPPRDEGGPPDMIATDAQADEWELPDIDDLLETYPDQMLDVGDLRQRSRLIEETLQSLGVPVRVVEVNPGPTVTQFGLEPGYIERRDRQGNTVRGKVRVSAIQGLSDDIALALAAKSVRIEAPVPGRPVVGVEVPNPEPLLVDLRGVIASEEFEILDAPLAVALGRGVAGEAIALNLADLPHLLIAGSTGAGKSVLINALVACLLCHNTPETLRLLMVDPKRVELSGYNSIPHLLTPVIVEVQRVVGALQWLLREMDRRYSLFASSGVRHIAAYSAQGQPRLPYIVCIIDELADLMMVASDEVERCLCRLAQMARATGIHLVVATQRPSVDVITGLIKANFAARVAFAVSSQIDSRVILDTPGAERLLGRGDGLLMVPNSPLIRRIQGCWVSDEELERIVAHWEAQAVPRVASDGKVSDRPLVQATLWPVSSGSAVPGRSDASGARVDVTSSPESQAVFREGEDPLFAEAVELVRREGRASTTLLQRTFRIGYTRASRLLDRLEAQGVVGPAAGSNRSREVLATLAKPDTPEGHVD